MDGAIISAYPTMYEASDLNDAIAKAKTFIYIYMRGTKDGARLGQGLWIPVCALTSEGYYFRSDTGWGTMQCFMRNNSYSNLSCTWEASATGVVWKYYYM